MSTNNTPVSLDEMIAESLQLAFPAMASIVSLRCIGPHGGQGCRLRYTPPDAPPKVGAVVGINGKPHKVLAVTQVEIP